MSAITAMQEALEGSLDNPVRLLGHTILVAPLTQSLTLI